MSLFELVRHDDVSGISGTGVVAEGVVFSDGSVALHWVCGKWPTSGTYPCMEAVLDVHGHGGKTEVRYVASFPRGGAAESGSSAEDGHAGESDQRPGLRSVGVVRSVLKVPSTRVL